MIRFVFLLLIALSGLSLAATPGMAQNEKTQTLSSTPADPFAYKPYDPTASSPEDKAAQEQQQYRLDEENMILIPVMPAAPEVKGLNLGSLQIQAEPKVPPDEIPEILLMEMDTIVRNCRANYTYNNFHDCECLGVKFVDARLKSDPEVSKETIFTQIGNECPSEERIAGFVYNGCMAFMESVRPDDFKEYCECTANAMALSYTRRPILNVGYIDNLRRGAYYSCGIRARQRLVDQIGQ